MPARRHVTKLRRKPRQERARATIEAILQAATYILVERGWSAFTTNRVAERAGVNIASLYQYFPNKEAIVAELQRRHVAKVRAAFPDALPGLRSKRSLREMLGVLVRAGVEEHRVAPALHRVFSEELPASARKGLPPHDQEALRLWQDAVQPFVRNVPDVALAAFIARVSVHAIIHEATATRPELLDDPRLVDETVLLLERYLRRPARRAGKRRRSASV